MQIFYDWLHSFSRVISRVIHIVACMHAYMPHPCRIGGTAKLFCEWLCHVPFPSAMFGGLGTCVFTRILMILMLKQFWKTPSPRVAQPLLLWLFVSHPAPRSTEGRVDHCAENRRRTPLCRAVSTPRKRILNRTNSGVRSARLEWGFLFVLIFFLRWNMAKKSSRSLKPQKIQREECIAWGSQCID